MGGQDFKILPSTSSSLTMVPMQAEWCNADCAEARGIQYFNAQQSLGFDPNSSKSWKAYGTYSIPVQDILDIDWTPDARPDASYGLDNVGLGPTSPSSLVLAGLLVAEYKSPDFFLGSFGLSSRSINLGNGAIPPFLTTFNQSNQIPSLSYGYTAGAFYRE